jgi:hypothetical protein
MSVCFFLVPVYRARRLTVRAGRGAAVGVVTEGVNVHTTLSVGIVAGDVPWDGGLGTLRGLLEGNGTGDLGVSAEDGNYESYRQLLLMVASPAVHSKFESWSSSLLAVEPKVAGVQILWWFPAASFDTIG